MKLRNIIIVIVLLVIFIFIIIAISFNRSNSDHSRKSIIIKKETLSIDSSLVIHQNSNIQYTTEHSRVDQYTINNQKRMTKNDQDINFKYFTTKSDSILYNNAIHNISSGDLISGKKKLLQLLSQNDKCIFLNDCFKQLYLIESQTDNYDESLIKILYKFTNSDYPSSVITSAHSHIARLSLLNDDYKQAINHFEKCIDNANTTIDSLYAIIDLGYSYLLQYRSNNKNMYFGKYKNYIPSSPEDFYHRKTEIEDQVKDIILSD